MSDFTPSKKTAQDFNNGVQYVGYNPNTQELGDYVEAETINNLIESQLYSQEEAEIAKQTAQDAKDLIEQTIQGQSIPPAIGLHHIQFNGEPTPAEIWAGTAWEIDTDYAGRFIRGSGSGYILGQTGGSNQHSHDVNNLVALMDLTGSGQIVVLSKSVNPYTCNYIVETGGTGKHFEYNYNGGVTIGGSLENASNVPPYKVVNVWKRTA